VNKHESGSDETERETLVLDELAELLKQTRAAETRLSRSVDLM